MTSGLIMKLFTGCIYDSFNNKTRISVMSRHTLDDGITADPKITSNSYDEWIPEVGPPGKIIAPYLKGKLKWNKYEDLYKEFLRGDDIVDIVIDLALRTMDEEIVLLCKEREGENCHRNILAEECRTYRPELEIVRL